MTDLYSAGASFINALFFTCYLILGVVFLDLLGLITFRNESDILVLAVILALAFAVFSALPSGK